MNTRTTSSPPHAEFFPAPRSPAAPARILATIVEDAEQLRRFWPVVQNMVAQELRVRYQRSVLGFFWTLLNPILMMATLTVVFSQLLGDDPKKYAITLFSGIVPWGLLSGCLTECAFCIIQNEGLIRKIFLPKLIFPLTRVLINLVTMVLSFAALFLLLAPLGASFKAQMLLLPLIIALFTVFSLGLGLIVATMNTFYRDCSHLVTVFLQAWYFATPILYPATRFQNVPWMLALNPAYPFIRLFQNVISDGVWPSLTLFLAAAGIATVSLGVGYAAFKSNEAKLIFRL
ncbi:MAG: ABC-type polysaccharide/polyol phosphate export system, permease component [Planctomycetota bacterium]|nr:ABC-type polysaccharide/polyol phosphate export system, permease component [Planctomycetota bacterium]